MSLLEIIPVWIREISDNLKTQEMCNEAMRIEPYSLAFVPDCFKTQEMCDKAIITLQRKRCIIRQSRQA